jgi:hypothetical protein
MEKIISEEELKRINEATTVEDLVDTEVLVGAIDRIIQKDSIAYQVSDVRKLTGPTGRVNGYRRDKATDKMIVTTALVEAYSRTIKSEFTLETLKDNAKLYGENFHEVLAYYFVDELAYDIDADFITMCKTAALATTDLAFDGATYNSNILDVVTQVFAKINKERVNLASRSKRPLKTWAIVSPNIASLLMNNSILAQDVDKGDSGVSLLGSFAGMDIYLDNTHSDPVDYVLLGVKGNGYSKGATVIAPYEHTFFTSQEASTGERRYFMLDRLAMTQNPSDTLGDGLSSMMATFSVDLSDLTLYQ